jgi:hypothetical protein
MREVRPAIEACPSAPPAYASVQARTLHRACLIVGGLNALGARLEASTSDLERWISDEEMPPERLFLRCVELLLLYASDAGGRPT